MVRPSFVRQATDFAINAFLVMITVVIPSAIAFLR
jgi:hypothetical protein